MIGRALDFTIHDPARDAEDIVQEVFLHLLELPELPTFKNADHERYYLRQAVRNRIYDISRAKKLHRGFGDEETLERTEVPDVADQAIASVLLDPLIDEAATDFRTAATLMVAAGWSQQELADILDCPRQTVTSACYRFRHREKPARRTRPYKHIATTEAA